MSAKYKVGDEVQCVSDPSLIGTVVDICEYHAGLQWYRVNFGPAGRPKRAEIDLRSFVPSDTPADNLIKGAIDGYQEFQRLMTFQRLLRDHPLRNNIYAFNASRTRFYPYQFKPLLKFLDSPRHRLLIADEVGLGKTIEAGLILTEMRARQTVQRVLVVCPSNLSNKWKLELKRRFGEDFEILSASSFSVFLTEYGESPQETALNGIISLESIRSQSILERLEALSPSLDLVIVDEAHHMRNFGRKQRRAGVLLSHCADAMLHLTATPIHLGSENLFSLLNILDEEEFPDLFTADHRFRENEPIVKVQTCLGHIPPNLEEAIDLLREISETPNGRGNPSYEEAVEALGDIVSKGGYSSKHRGSLLLAQRDLADLNMIGHIFTRTRKREVQTSLAVRRAFPIRLEFTDLEKRFYDAVTDYVRAESESHCGSPLIQQWMLNMPQRRMASSIPAMVNYYRTNLGLSAEDCSEDSDIGEEELGDGLEGRQDLESARNKLQTILAKWPVPGPDTKYDKFIEILKGIRAREGRPKIMIFAFFKDTLKYLQQRLKQDGFECGMITGDIPPVERKTIIESFTNESRFQVLLSSRVGSEGLDFQFCDTLFNYDLPWNPMEIEQRIGRLDRIGQESPIIRIYNFWIEGTIEQRILERLYARIGIFERSIGELEMILGEELGTIERDILSRKLTREEEERLIEQKALAIEARLQAVEKLEKDAAQYIGTDHFFDEEVKMIRERRRYITGEQMRRFIAEFLRTNCPRSRLEYDQENNLGKLYPDEELRSLLMRFGVAGDVVRFLSSGREGVPVTFDSQAAFDHPKHEFINVLHPLTLCIVKDYTETTRAVSNAHHIILKTDMIAKGLYIYFIYRLSVYAARGSNTLEMVVMRQDLEPACDQDVAEALLGEMVERGTDPIVKSYEVDPGTAVKACQNASEIFLDKVSRIREQIKKNNDAFVDRRMESLKTSYGKNLRMKRQLLDQGILLQRAGQYIRMLEGTIRRLESELEQKRLDLERQRSVQVEYDEISVGILEVT